MDINTQNSSGMMNGMPPTPQTEKKIGPIVGALIIVLMLIIAALYFFGQKLNTESQNSAAIEQATTTMQEFANDDEMSSIESELDIQLKDVDYSF